jgi:hypothetical protein
LATGSQRPSFTAIKDRLEMLLPDAIAWPVREQARAPGGSDMNVSLLANEGLGSVSEEVGSE